MQNTLFPELKEKNIFPSTRYQGSKSKFVDWIWAKMSNLDFHTVLDAFGGTGAVSYKLKDNGKAVTYNDILPFNAIIGKAIIENSTETLSEDEVDFVLSRHPKFDYPTFISDNFHDIYYTDEENRWLDMVRYNITKLSNEYRRSIAWFALFQACIIKRPYNLFHRKNLYVRLTEVERSFGNKKTWDTPFERHFRSFVVEANRAVFDNGELCRTLNKDARSVDGNYDLVYIDTPYLNERGVGVDYADFYHFLNGLVNYDNWSQLIDFKSRHHRMIRSYSIWNDKDNIIHGFENLIENYKNSILVISYRSNGIPSIDGLVGILDKYGRSSEVYYSGDIKYVLSDSKSKEVLIVSRPV